MNYEIELGLIFFLYFSDVEENLENDDGLLIPAPNKVGLKNTDKSLYFCSENGQFCPFCKKHYKRTVSHIIMHHPDKEVFVSRISPKMLDDITNEKRSFTKFLKGTTPYLRTVCIFCEEQKDYSSHYWIDHIRSHTGEYGNTCLLCLKLCCFYTHCGMPTTRAHPFDLIVRDLEAFLCLDCNYVQISEENMEKHLRNEHGFTDIDDRYKEFILIPAFRDLQLQSNPNDELSTGIYYSTIQFRNICTFSNKYLSLHNNIEFISQL